MSPGPLLRFTCGPGNEATATGDCDRRCRCGMGVAYCITLYATKMSRGHGGFWQWSQGHQQVSSVVTQLLAVFRRSQAVTPAATPCIGVTTPCVKLCSPSLIPRPFPPPVFVACNILLLYCSVHQLCSSAGCTGNGLLQPYTGRMET